MDDTTHPVTEREGDAVGREQTRLRPPEEGDPILSEHLEKALAQAEDKWTRYHLRAALQRLELE